MKLSIVIPSIRTDNWPKMLSEISRSVNGLDYEVIIIGPKNVEGLEGYTFIQDFGAPTRAIQIGSIAATGDVMCWLSDDGDIYINTLREAFESFVHDANTTIYDIMCLRYTENHEPRPNDYWVCGYHADLRLDGIDRNKLFAPVGMLYKSWFRNLGGFDCQFNHCNMSCIDLSLRIQNAGGKVILSPNFVGNFKWVRGDEGDHLCIHNSELNHDIPRFKQIYSSNQKNRTVLNYNNWMFSSPVWDRFR